MINMKLKDLDNFVVSVLCDGKRIINKLLELYTDTKDFNYFWGYIKADTIHNTVKIKADDVYYSEVQKYIRCQKVYFIINKNCIDDATEEIVILTDSESVLQILREYYWELDEVCILDENFSWAIAINHNFEIFYLGRKIVDYFAEINLKNDIRNLLIKEV
ncbi:MAG: hypothetical protein II838_07635 [Lachnospiraceae bacterium]|nr:hypothetical protein [Lachnospiraceae bacterium]